MVWVQEGSIAWDWAESISDHVEERAHRGFDESVRVISGRLPVTAQHHHAVSITQTSVTRRAVNVETSLAAFDVRLSDRNWKLIDVLAADFACVTRFVDAQMAARDGSFYCRTR